MKNTDAAYSPFPGHLRNYMTQLLSRIVTYFVSSLLRSSGQVTLKMLVPASTSRTVAIPVKPNWDFPMQPLEMLLVMWDLKR